MPRTFGDATVHVSHFDALVEGEKELPEHKPDVLTEVELSIGKQIAENLVENGATLQMGNYLLFCMNVVFKSSKPYIFYIKINIITSSLCFL